MSGIFVRGLSRSGGTLMATILDAHPDIAMSYETYEHLLMSSDGSTFELGEIADQVRLASGGALKRSFGRRGKQLDPNIKKFVGRAERSGINADGLIALLEEHFATGAVLATRTDRIRFVERLTKAKMQAEGKTRWGAKIVSTYDEFDSIYSDAKYLFMLRDGRDVAASRKMVGEFGQSIEHIADGWCRQIQKFEKFAEKAEGRAFFVSYEGLARNPVEELHELMRKLELEWSDRLISYHSLNLSIHRNATGHLSGDQVKGPISTESIGRWKRDLEETEASRFQDVAEDVLKQYGYI